jgi:hypothetical protein
MSKDRTTSEASNEFETKYDNRFRRIREAAVAATRELSVFRLAGSVTQEALDAEVARIAQEKLQPYGCDLVVCRMNDGVLWFLIKVRSTGREYDLIKSFFPVQESHFRLRNQFIVTMGLSKAAVSGRIATVEDFRNKIARPR